MISFREYLLSEVKRDTRRAVALGLKLAARHGKYSDNPRIKGGGLIGFKGYDPKDREVGHSVGVMIHVGDETRGKQTLPRIERLAIKDLTPTQSSTEFNLKQAHHKMEDDEPIYVLKHSGKHYVLNGHHRIIAKRLKGETHIDGHVWDSAQED